MWQHGLNCVCVCVCDYDTTAFSKYGIFNTIIKTRNKRTQSKDGHLSHILQNKFQTHLRCKYFKISYN